MMLHHIRESKLVELHTKMCILIPKSRSMMGCMDETNLLEYGEVFLQCSYENSKSPREPCNIIGDCDTRHLQSGEQRATNIISYNKSPYTQLHSPKA
ncbi:hypothetical protein YC2023_012733 [Brassica napus]